MIYSTHRPDGYRGRGDSRLAQLVRNTRRVLSDTQQGFAYDSLRLGRDALGDLGGILVDFAEDLHSLGPMRVDFQMPCEKLAAKYGNRHE